MYINHNQMAKNVSNTLTSHYSNLATSTQRLSSGLRVNSAADDAAGLAIRELMRADIAALDQGVRNANDAISLIQTADGALGIIDEKLIRMKELAEQAATGTYDSTQRLMIDSEYQAMASEITRIANATDFNGVKLLDGTLEGTHDGSGRSSEDGLTATGAMKVHFGTGNDSAEDYYYIEVEEMTSQALGLGNGSTWQDVQGRGAEELKKSLTDQIKNDTTLTDKQRGEMLAQVDKVVEQYNQSMDNATDYKQAFKYWNGNEAGTAGFMEPGKEFVGNSSLMTEYLKAADGAKNTNAGATAATDVVTAIQEAIEDAAPSMSELNAKLNGADAAETTKIQEEVWENLTTAAKDAAKKQGLTDEEIATMMTGLAGVKAANLPTAANTVAGGTWYGTELANITGQVNTDLTSARTGQGTIAQEAALRNRLKVDYANADPADKPAAGPTVAADVVNQIQSEFDKIKGQMSEASLGLTTANTNADANKHLAKLNDKVKEIGLAAGMTEDEVANLLKQVDLANPTNAFTAGTFDAKITAIDTAIAALGTANATTANSGADAITTATYAYNIAVRNQGTADAKANDELDKFWNSLRDSEKQQLEYAWGKAASYNLSNAKVDREQASYGINATISFDDADKLANALDAANNKVSKMDFAGYSIDTQENAQQALNAINDAIVQKDKVRAHLGALQNRLENTVSNLTVQSENLQAAESRISDVDVAKEMTNFVRNQILTQSAVAMLSQANSMPQMAMQLIG